jgi:serine protease Do
MLMKQILGGRLIAALRHSAAAAVLACAGAWQPALAQQGPPSVAPIAEKLFDAVVNISTSQAIKGSHGTPLPKVPKGSPFEEFFKDFFDKDGNPGDLQRVSSLGSGFVIDAAGIIATNNHVIEDADEIFVNFNDGTRLKVTKVIGRDVKTDLAVLEVKPDKPLSAARLGDSAKMRVGDWVMAIGNPFGLGGSLTVGVISALNRDIQAGPYDEFLQTDASINKGNSGGPLFNMAGEVIGINSAIISPTGGSIGLGFAIPYNEAREVIAQLRDHGEMRRGWIGVSIQSVNDAIASSLGMHNAKGAMIAQVAKGGPAEAAGFKAGDVVVSFDGRTVADVRSLPRLVALAQIGKTVSVEILRDGKTMTLSVKVDRLAETVEKKADSAQPGAGQTDTPDKAPGDGTDKPEAAVTNATLGMTLEALTPAARDKFGIAEKVEGVLISDLDAKGLAATHGVQKGDVISEITNQRVDAPSDASDRIDGLRKDGRKSVLLLLSDPKGEIRFVAVPFPTE